MSDVVVLLPEADPERDAAIFKAWRTGKKSIVKLAREYNLPQTQVTAILDQFLPSLTPRAQVRELKRLLYDLEELRQAYHDIALKQADAEAANVSIRTAHEIAQLRMFVGGSAHNDPVELQRAADPKRLSGPEAIYQALTRLANEGKLEPETEARVRDLAKYQKAPEEPEGGAA